MARRRKVGNLLALALLALLVPGRPMHPYEMAVLLRRTGKEQDMKIKWGSLYTVVQNLEKHGFITAVDTGRAGRRPERTRYAITETGAVELREWLRELVAAPEREHPRFAAALSVLGVLPPDEVAGLLRERLRRLREEIQTARGRWTGRVPRSRSHDGRFRAAGTRCAFRRRTSMSNCLAGIWLRCGVVPRCSSAYTRLRA